MGIVPCDLLGLLQAEPSVYTLLQQMHNSQHLKRVNDKGGFGSLWSFKRTEDFHVGFK